MSDVQPILCGDFSAVACRALLLARSSVRIMVFDWRFYSGSVGSATQVFNSTILELQRSGLDVRCLVHNAVTRAKLKALGFNVRTAGAGRLLHAKLIIIDEKHLIIGSHNFSQMAFSRNLECSVLIKYCDCIDSFINFFDNVFNNGYC